jgi:hypothetical protein
MSGYPRSYRNREVETTKSSSQHCFYASLQAVFAWMRSQVFVEVTASHQLSEASRDGVRITGNPELIRRPSD